MASNGSDPDAEYALSRLLQRGTVADYQNEFEMLISRVTGKFESFLASIYIFGLKQALQRALLWSNPTTLAADTVVKIEETGEFYTSEEHGMKPEKGKSNDDGFKWGVQEVSAFEELKQRISTTPVLSLTDFSEVMSLVQ
ncbi:hypothetical protein Tco_1286591 [Tanacetum coccineum]